MMNDTKVVVIAGPTGVGKTELSLKMCEEFNGEIINADASQFKRGLNVGTAKIDLSTTSIKHHLIDIIECDEMFSISDYQKIARKLICDIENDSKLPFIVGGSGLYINSVLYDYNLDSPKHNEESETEYDNYTNEELHAILEKLDYESSLNIHKNNRRRVVRAIELAESGNLISKNLSGDNKIYNPLIICLNTDRKILYDRINQRVLRMLDFGWIEECKGLMNSKYDIQNIKDIGYQEVFSYLKGIIKKEEMIEIISKKTRNYAKRQLTWMRNKLDCVFIEVNHDDLSQTIDKVRKIIINYLQDDKKEKGN